MLLKLVPLSVFLVVSAAVSAAAVHRDDAVTVTMEANEPGGVAEWIDQTLRKAPASGSRSVVLPLFQSTQKVGKVEGQARVSATWSFK